MPSVDARQNARNNRSARARAVVGARWRAWAVVALAAVGVWLGRDLAGVPAWSWLAGGAMVAVAALLTTRVACIALMGASCVLVGAGWTAMRLHTRAPDHLLELVCEADTPGRADPIVRVEGVLTRDAAVSHRAPDPLDPPGIAGTTTLIDLHLMRAEVMQGGSGERAWVAASGRVRVRIAGDLFRLRAGDAVRVTGVLSAPDPPGNPGAPDWHMLSAQRGGAGFVSVPSEALIEPTAGATGMLGVRAGLWRVRAWAHARASAAVGEDPLVRALVLGARDPDHPDSPEQAFARVGLAHLVAISGLHLGVLAGGIAVLVRLTGERSRVALFCSVVLVAACLMLVPARPPVVRAALLFGVVVVGDLLGARRDRLTLLAWITLGLIFWRPLDVFGLGLPLTAGVTALLLWMSGSRRFTRRGLVSLSRSPASRMPAVRAARWFRRRCAGTLRVCIACWAVAQPLILLRGGALSPLAWLATPIVLPQVALTLGVGYAAALVGLVWPAGGRWVGGWSAWLGRTTADFVLWIDGMPMTSFMPTPPSAVWVAAATLAVVGVLAVSRRWRMITVLALVSVVAWGVFESSRRAQLDDGVLVRIDTLDVGDGSCHVIRSGGEAVVWDAGSLSGVGRAREIGLAMRALGVRRARTAVVTHPNIDHYNLLPALAPELGVTRVLVTRALLDRARERAGGPEAAFVRAMRSLGVEIIEIGAGATWTVGHARVDVRWPTKGVDAARGALSTNDLSVVASVRVTTDAGERAVLMTGDVQRDAIVALLDEPGLRADVLEAPHHGAWTPAAVALVERLGPSVVVQSTGRARAGDTRWTAVRAHTAWRSTAERGAVWVEVDRRGGVRAGSVR